MNQENDRDNLKGVAVIFLFWDMSKNDNFIVKSPFLW